MDKSHSKWNSCRLRHSGKDGVANQNKTNKDMTCCSTAMLQPVNLPVHDRLELGMPGDPQILHDLRPDGVDSVGFGAGQKEEVGEIGSSEVGVNVYEFWNPLNPSAPGLWQEVDARSDNMSGFGRTEGYFLLSTQVTRATGCFATHEATHFVFDSTSGCFGSSIQLIRQPSAVGLGAPNQPSRAKAPSRPSVPGQSVR